MTRLDVYLYTKDSSKSRTYYQDLIKNGKVSVNNKTITKASFMVYDKDKVSIVKENEEYVSRGGLKLKEAIYKFNLDFKDKVVLDIGASTGGFSDCSLKHGAKKVYAVDVGTSQLVESLKNDPRVVNKEQLNFRYASKKDLDEMVFDIVTIDVSFISLKHIFDNLKQFIKEDSLVVALIKPQFEAGLDYVGKNGKVNSYKGQEKAINNAIKEANEVGLNLINLTNSPISGKKSGNDEYLGLFSLKPTTSSGKININEIINKRGDI